MRIGRLSVSLIPLAECDCCGRQLHRRRHVVDMVNQGGCERVACPPCAVTGGHGLEWVRA